VNAASPLRKRSPYALGTPEAVEGATATTQSYLLPYCTSHTAKRSLLSKMFGFLVVIALLCLSGCARSNLASANRMYVEAYEEPERRTLEESLGPSILWSFDEGEGPMVFNEAGIGFDGILRCRGEACGLPERTPTGAGYAVALDGISNYILISSSDELNLSSGFTIAAWVNPQKDSRETMSVFNSEWDLRVALSKGRIYARLRDDGGLDSANRGSMEVSPQQWHHVIVVFDLEATYPVIYVDGEGDYTGEGALLREFKGLEKASRGPFYIGAMEGRRSFFSGEIDDVSIYSRVLRESDIRVLFNEGRANHAQRKIPALD